MMVMVMVLGWCGYCYYEIREEHTSLLVSLVSQSISPPTSPLNRLVREIQTYHHRKEYRWQAEAIQALQEAAEAHLVVSSGIMVFPSSSFCNYY